MSLPWCWKRSCGVVAPLATTLLLAGCGGSDGGGAGGGVPSATSVTAQIGAAGGSVTGPNGVVVSIPPEALTGDTQVTVALGGAGAPALPARAQTLGSMVSVTPHGTRFSVPVTVNVPFDPAQLPAGQRPFLIKTNAQGDAWQQLVATRSGNTLTAAVTGFSVIGVACCYDPVHIVDQPDDQTAFENGFAFFRVEAFGYSPSDDNVRFQWFRNGRPMPGETNREILIPHVTLADDNALFMARVTGAFGITEDSRAARLLVTAAAPVIVNQPVDVQVVAGQLARFTAASTSGVAQTLQWQRSSNGGPFVDLVNETATALALTTVAGDDGARLRLCATNTGGTTCTRGALLSVIAQAVAPVITQQPQPVSTAAGSSANFTVLASGGNLSYAWEQGRDGTTFTAHPTCGDAATCTLSNTTLADDRTFLRVRVFNSVGSVTSANALLTVRLNPGAALTRVGGGGGHSIGLRANATLRAWGRNSSGQLGDGTTDIRTGAVDVAGLSDVATFSVGFDHVLAIRANGEVWAWGENRDGQLGDGTTVDRSSPQPVPGLGAARAVAAGLEGANTFSLAVAADGTVWSWGDNSYGQLGDGTVNDRLSPGPVASLTEVVTAAGGSRHALALRRDGTVWAWGANNVGQLGNGTTTASLVPTPIALSAPIVAIATGSHSSLALSDTGAVFAWGHNVSGQLGDGTTVQRLAPVAVALPAPAIAVAVGWDGHALALLLDGRVFAWGFNEYGQLGLGTDTPFEATPMQVIAPLPADIVAIGAGANHSLALDAAGNVWAWGNNGVRQLGDGTTEPQRPTPVQVFGVTLN